MKKIIFSVFFAVLSAGFLPADTVILKDGQEFSADVTGFDDYFVNVKLEQGSDVSIPWLEVRSIKHTTTGQSWLEETHITAADADVSTLVVPLSGDTAFLKALFPGIAVHGSGHFYAKDTNMGMSLLSAEIVSLIMMGLSVAEIVRPEEGSQASAVSQAVFYTGLTIFGGSWLYDLIFCGSAAERFNSENVFLIQEKKQ